MIYKSEWRLSERFTRESIRDQEDVRADDFSSILFVQLLATTLVAAALHTSSGQAFTKTNPWTLWVSIFGSFGTLIAVHFKRHQYPLNLALLGAFTAFEAMMIGTVTSYYSAKIVLQALMITVGIFAGLTLFTFQSKVRRIQLPLCLIDLPSAQYDFSNMGPYLFAGLMGMLVTGLVQIFVPFSKTTDLIIASFGVLLFSGYSECSRRFYLSPSYETEFPQPYMTPTPL